jgi:hypothetical protein
MNDSPPTEPLPGGSAVIEVPGVIDPDVPDGADIVDTIDPRALPLMWRKRRFPFWVRFGLAGVKGRLVMLVHLWAMLVLTALSALALLLAFTNPKILPFGFRDPAWSGTMVCIGCIGLVHLRAVLRWLDERAAW